MKHLQAAARRAVLVVTFVLATAGALANDGVYSALKICFAGFNAHCELTTNDGSATIACDTGQYDPTEWGAANLWGFENVRCVERMRDNGTFDLQDFEISSNVLEGSEVDIGYSFHGTAGRDQNAYEFLCYYRGWAESKWREALGKVVSAGRAVGGCDIYGPEWMTAAVETEAPVPERMDEYGAIAVSKRTLSWGAAWDRTSREDAEADALANCGQHASDCRVATWTKNACAALATGNSGWGSRWEEELSSAQSIALSICSEHTRGCTIEVDFCTGK